MTRYLFAAHAFFLVASAAQGQVKPGTYASVNSFEKVCLRLEENQQFQLFSSNCTTDRDFSGRWQVRADTLVLNSDQGPAMELGKVMERGTSVEAIPAAGEALATEPADGSRTTLTLRSMDAPLLASIKVSMGQETAFPNAAGEVFLNQPLDTIYFYMEGMGLLAYHPTDPMTNRIEVDIRFKNLDKPSLFNDRWLQEGRKLRYLPGPGSTRSSDIELVRGKRCFYKMP